MKNSSDNHTHLVKNHMDIIERLLLENKAWAAEKLTDDPKFFKRLSSIQKPDFLWIGCSDSRVPADQITGTQPGEIFVHRNVANLVVKNDLNLLTVLEYAVKYLKVKHVIICGHYGCGGVLAADSNEDFGDIDKWLINIKNVKQTHIKELQKITDKTLQINRLIEINVIEQVKNLAATKIIQDSWKEGTGPTLHGWVYGLKDGIIKNILEMEAPGR